MVERKKVTTGASQAKTRPQSPEQGRRAFRDEPRSTTPGQLRGAPNRPGGIRDGDRRIRVHRGHHLPDEVPSPDVYFTPGYGRAASLMEGGEWVLLEAFDGGWQVPLIVRTLADGTKDAISPYGYSGVYASPSLSLAQVQAAWPATIAALGELGIISVLLRHSPLVPQAADLPGLRPILSEHPTVVLEAADSESAWSDMASSCRNQIRKALRTGYTGEVRAAEAQHLASGSDFRRVYGSTMQRLRAASRYDVTDEYGEELLAGLGSNLLIAEVRDPLGAVASSMLLMRHGRRLHGHLSGSEPEHARMGSNNLIMWTAIQFAADAGISQFHLGGGMAQRDGLFRYKRSFGGRELAYNVCGLVVDEERYAAQVKARAAGCHTTAEALLASGYFPAYRGGHDSSGGDATMPELVGTEARQECR